MSHSQFCILPWIKKKLFQVISYISFFHSGTSTMTYYNTYSLLWQYWLTILVVSWSLLFQPASHRQFRVHSHERRNEFTPVWDFKPVWKQVLSTWNFISVKMTDMKSIQALSFKCTCALNATSNESALIHFVWGKLCSHENLMPVWNFISVKMTDMKSIPFWVSFHLNSCEHK